MGRRKAWTNYAVQNIPIYNKHENIFLNDKESLILTVRKDKYKEGTVYFDTTIEYKH